MEKPSCVVCSESIMLQRAGSRTCSPKCRQRLSRMTRKTTSFPKEMTSRDRWVRSSYKRPVTVAGRPASVTDESTWSTYKLAHRSSAGDHLGYVLGDGVGCLDLDHCFIDGVLTDWATEILEANKGTYVEVSMSGTGLHIFGLTEERPGRKIRDHRNVEIYSRMRFIALTGKRYASSSLELKPLQLP